MRTDIAFDQLRQRLERRFQELSVWQDDRKDQSAPVELDQARMGRLTRMDAMQQQTMSRASDRLISLERRRIQTALERMKSGDYGYCIVCEEEIAEGRLQPDPSLLTCIDCARNAEQG